MPQDGVNDGHKKMSVEEVGAQVKQEALTVPFISDYAIRPSMLLCLYDSPHTLSPPHDAAPSGPCHGSEYFS